MFKVYGGTKRDDAPDLCDSCTYATVVRGHSLREVMKTCSLAWDHSPQFRVAECRRYHRRGTPTLEKLEEIAWTIDLDKGKRVIGFLDPEKRRKRGENGPAPPSCPVRDPFD